MSRLLATLFLALCTLMASAVRTPLTLLHRMLTNSVFLLQFPAEDGSFKADRVVDVSWEVAPFPGAPPITLNGTVEQVYAKLVQMNPNYDDDFKDIDPDLEPTVGFDKRADTLMCEGEKTADTKHIKEGIKYLRKVKGSPHLSPWDCGRVSCSYYSGIVWCNDVSRHSLLDNSIHFNI